MKQIEPINDSKSDCYGCTAMMCDHKICRGDQYFWLLDNCNEPIEIEIEIAESKTINKIEKEILHCYMCGWEHHNPSEWQNHKKATNGTLQKWCGGCGRISLLEKNIIINQ